MRRYEARAAVRTGATASARWGYPSDLSSVRAVGRIIGFCDAPQVLIETEDGERIWWRHDMTEEVSGD